MRSFIRNSTLCAILGAAMGAHAAPVSMPNGTFTTPDGALWAEVSGGITYNYPTTGGNPGGYGVMDAVNGQWAIWVGNGDAAITLASLGLTAGNTYNFSQDMKVFDGTNVGGFKVDFVPAGSSNDRRIAKIGDGSTWETYTYPILIPEGTTAIKIVPLWGANSMVGYDNFKVDDTPVAPPTLPPGIPNPGFETPNGLGWHQASGGITYSYPAAGGNPGGHGVMDASNGQWAVWVANSDAALTLGQLSLTPGKTYNFKQDMKILSGSNIGGLKIDFVPSGSTGDMRIPKIGDGSTWETYTYPVAIPPGTTGLKIVPLWGISSSVAYDNFAVDPTPVIPPPIIPKVQNGDFEIAGGAGWQFFTDLQTVEYLPAGGNPGGQAIIDGTGGGFGVMVAFNNAEVTAASLGLTPGETYTFQVDMRIIDGDNIGGLRLEGPGGFATERRPTIIGDGSQWATYSIDFTLQNGLNPVTQFKLVTLWGINSTVAYDNFKILLPPPAAPLQASIALGTSLSWTAGSQTNQYQAQKSTNGTTWTDLGPASIGNAVTAVFDEGKSAFYQVLTRQPSLQETVYNGSFAEAGDFTDEAKGWQPVQSQLAFRQTTGGRGNSACMRIDVLNSGPNPNGSEIQQNTNNVSGNTNGQITPGNSYTFSFWAKQLSLGVSYEQRYRVSFLNGSGGIVGGGNFQNFTAPVGGDWTQFTQSGLVAPAGAVSALIQILGVTGAVDGGFGAALIDDASLVSQGFGPASVVPSTTAPAVEIRWPSKSGKTYQVSSSPNLQGWTDFGAPINGTGEILRVMDTPLGSSKFYTVEEN